MVPTNKTINNNKKLTKYKYIDTLRRDHIISFVDIMRQTLKSKQRKQITLTVHQNVY